MIEEGSVWMLNNSASAVVWYVKVMLDIRIIFCISLPSILLAMNASANTGKQATVWQQSVLAQICGASASRSFKLSLSPVCCLGKLLKSFSQFSPFIAVFITIKRCRCSRNIKRRRTRRGKTTSWVRSFSLSPLRIFLIARKITAIFLVKWTSPQSLSRFLFLSSEQAICRE